METTTSTVSEMSAEQPVKLSNAERLTALEESRRSMENAIGRTGVALGQTQELNEGLRDIVDVQRQRIEELSARVQSLDQLVKEQDAFMDELEKDMKEAFKSNGRMVAGWLEEKDRQLAALRGSGGMEERMVQLEELVRRLQYRVATR